MLIKDICNYLDQRYPRETASDFDTSIGFAIGNKNIEVKNVLFALDLTMDVLKEAKELNANFIITHHPFLFNPINRIMFDNPQGEMIKFMCDNNISTYAMHTNLDVAIDGVNDSLLKKLDAKLEHVECLKDDFLRIGEVKECSVKELVNKVKDAFELNTVRVIGNLDKKVKYVGIVGGSGGSIPMMNDALRNGVDCYITGEVHHDKGIYALQNGLTIIEVNHGVEKFVFENIISDFEKEFGKIFYISKVNTDPFVGM